ncbi:MAG: alpha/beta fold hydrolase [Chloroflexi bacterium]|nr:alpha/beta fold hydrolase [Chloroflexota bacterium]
MKESKLNPFLSGRSLLSVIVLALVIVVVMSAPILAQEGTPEMNSLPNIVLVHGAFADGSSWSSVIQQLQAKGYNVIAPQFPLTSLQADVTRLKQVLATLSGPTIVAGHSYGGQVTTSLGKDSPNVAGLVYIAAFGLDEGETIAGVGANYPAPPATANLHVDAQGLGWLPQDDFVKLFAADVDPVQAKVMFAVQQPVSVSVFGDKMGVPEWKSVPSWYLVATNDQAIAPDEERFFAKRMGATTVEVPSSHVAMVSHPDDVAMLIDKAGQSVAGAS